MSINEIQHDSFTQLIKLYQNSRSFTDEEILILLKEQVEMYKRKQKLNKMIKDKSNA